MGFCFSLLAICVVFIMAIAASRWDKHAAYRLLESSHHLFEPEPTDAEPSAQQGAVRPRQNEMAARHRPNPLAKRRPYISPLVKKRVAARQGWRCALCREILDETFEIDHRTPLFRGGHPTDEANLQALCKRDHMFKTAVLDRS